MRDISRRLTGSNLFSPLLTDAAAIVSEMSQESSQGLEYAGGIVHEKVKEKKRVQPQQDVRKRLQSSEQEGKRRKKKSVAKKNRVLDLAPTVVSIFPLLSWSHNILFLFSRTSKSLDTC